MEFSEQKEQINKLLKSGDVKEIVKTANVTKPVFHNAMRKNSILEMTGAQLKVWNCALEKAIERAKEIKQLEKKTEKIAESI